MLALLTKQTFRGRADCRRRCACGRVGQLLRFGAIVVGGVLGGVLGWPQWLTQGWFWWHTVPRQRQPLDLVTFSVLMGSFLQFNGVPVLAALVSLVLPAAPGERVWRLYFVGAC